MGFAEEARRQKLRWQTINTNNETNGSSSSPSTAQSHLLQPRIRRLDVLASFGATSLPPSNAASSPRPPSSSHALDLLRRVANDPGIVAIMNKYDWKVGSLAEMPPEGMVGVDPVCILGYNEGMGSRIVLRLRTDDLAGFRNYDVVRTVGLASIVVCLLIVNCFTGNFLVWPTFWGE